MNRYYRFFGEQITFIVTIIVSYTGLCSGESIRKRWRRCGKVDCNVPRCWL